jgi:radical SAM superfamily enzyme YgiQ (UPF0313 family)
MSTGHKGNKVLLFYGRFEEHQSYAYVPWSLIYLAAHLTRRGYDPVLIDEFVSPDYEPLLKAHAPDALLLGISAMTGRQITGGLKAMRLFKQYNPTAKIAWGNAHATAVPEETLRHPDIDYVVVNQSIESLPALLDTLSGAQGPPPKQVLYSEYPTAEAFAAFPEFDLAQYDLQPYLKPETRLLNYCSSVGCPGACTFCVWGGKHRWWGLPVQRVVDDLEWLVKTYHLTTVLFQDATFFTDKARVMAFAEEMLRRDVPCFWRADARVVDLLPFDQADMQLLADSGLDWVFVGVESTLPRIMQLFHKYLNLQAIDQIVEYLRAADIIFFFSLIFGVPTETTEELRLNKTNIDGLVQDRANVYFQKCIFTPYPGAPLNDLAVDAGFTMPQGLEEWAAHPLFIDTNRSLQDHRVWIDRAIRDDYFALFNSIRSERMHNRTLKPAGTKPRRFGARR